MHERNIDFMNHEHLPETIELFKFIEALDFELGDYFCWKSGGDGDNGEILMSEIDEYFKEQSTIDAEPVRHGHWEHHIDGTICSVCLESPCEIGDMRIINYNKPYCPNCGAKMDEVE